MLLSFANHRQAEKSTEERMKSRGHQLPNANPPQTPFPWKHGRPVWAPHGISASTTWIYMQSLEVERRLFKHFWLYSFYEILVVTTQRLRQNLAPYIIFIFSPRRGNPELVKVWETLL